MLRLLRILAFPISIVYGIVVFFRNVLFDIGVFRSATFKTPLICVGNLSVGGTGKTPMIEFLVRLLADHKIAVLSRGYRRKSSGFILAGPNHTASDLGDEPFQLFRKFPNITVAVDANRRNGISQLEALIKPDIILLDDAFQHRKVKPHVSILLTAYDELYPNDWYLPTGNLRDSKQAAKRADLIIVTKCPKEISATLREQIIRKLDPMSHQEVLFAHLDYADKVKSKGPELYALSEIRDKNIALVTGIAKPGPLLDYLRTKEISFKHFKFRDHHDFTEKEIASFRDFDLILTTEKDYVRLMGKAENLYYLEIEHVFGGSDKKILENKIKALL